MVSHDGGRDDQKSTADLRFCLAHNLFARLIEGAAVVDAAGGGHAVPGGLLAHKEL